MPEVPPDSTRRANPHSPGFEFETDSMGLHRSGAREYLQSYIPSTAPSDINNTRKDGYWCWRDWNGTEDSFLRVRYGGQITYSNRHGLPRHTFLSTKNYTGGRNRMKPTHGPSAVRCVERLDPCESCLRSFVHQY